MALRQHTTQFFLWQIRLSSEATPFQLRDKSAFPPKQRLFNSVKNSLFLQNNAFSAPWKIRLFLQTAYFRFYNKFVFALRKRTLRTKELHEEKTWAWALRTGECCLFVKIRDPYFPGHAPGKDTLRAANAATKEGANGGENGLSVSDYPLSSPSK